MVRVRNRYIIAEMIWEHTSEECDSRSKPNHCVTKEALSKSIKESVALNYGDYGSARILSNFRGWIFYANIYHCNNLIFSFLVQYLNTQTNVFVIRTSLDLLPIVWTSLTFLRAIKDSELVVVVIKAAPSLRTCKSVSSLGPFIWHTLAHLPF